MIGIDVAIKTRWDAKLLSSQITGGYFHGRATEQTAMPYCVFSEVSDAPMMGSRSSRYNRALVQFDVYAATPDDAGRYAKVVREAMCNADKAASNAISLNGTEGIIKRIEPDGNPLTLFEEDEVWRSMQTLAIVWAESRNLTPAS